MSEERRKAIRDKVRIYLTDQLKGRPNVRTMSREIMLAVTDFYKKPVKADGYRKKSFTDWHRPAWDSGGFQFLMGKLPNPDPMKTVDLYKRIGVKAKDLPIQLDLPPTYHMPKSERLGLVHLSAEFYWRMVEHIPFVIPVVHGWDYEELSASLELLENPDKLSSGSNLATAARNESKRLGAGAFMQSGRYVLDEAGNLKKRKSDAVGSGSYLSTGGTAIDNVTSDKSLVGAGSFKTLNYDEILKHVTSNKSHVSAGTYNVTYVAQERELIGVGAYSPMLYPWSMGNLNPHSDVRDRIIASPYPTVIDAGIVSPENAASVSAAKKVIASPMPNGIDLGQQPVIDRVKSSKVIAAPYPSNADVGWKNTILTNEGMKRKKKERISAGTFGALATSQTIQKKEKKPRVKIGIIIDRLATVLNMLRDRELFMLGGGSSHTQHLCFLGGATYSDTSSWRLKGYFGEILIPEVGARSIGYKDTSKRLKESEVPMLAECLRDSTHPLEGMSVSRFLEIGHMNMTEWYDTWKEKQWEIKPFPLRALHNAWVLKMMEEPIANEYANDPDRYYKYLTKRFDGRRQLTKRLNMLWSRLKRPWVQTTMGVYLKGGEKGIMS